MPKNTALIVTREKRGFLNILRCPLRNQTPLQRSISNLPPLPGASPTHTSPIRGPQPWVANSSASGPMPWTGPAPPFVDPQRDVCLCLEALSRGIMAKSRAFLARRPTGLNPGSAVLPAAAETLQELPSMTSIAGGSAASAHIMWKGGGMSLGRGVECTVRVFVFQSRLLMAQHKDNGRFGNKAHHSL